LRARQVLSRAIEIGQSRDEAGDVRTRTGPAEHELLLAKLVPSIVRDRRAARVLREWDLWVVAVDAARRTREKEESPASGFGVRETRAKAVDELAERRALRLEGLGRGSDPACTGTPEYHPRTISPSDLAREGLSRAVEFLRETGRILPRKLGRVGDPAGRLGKLLWKERFCAGSQ
jgi:hypothetical protein